MPLLTEAILLFGWDVETALNMPARRFFALLNEGRKQRARANAADHVALCDISSIALGDAKYFEDIRRVFLKRAIGKEGLPDRPALDPVDPATVELLESLTMAATELRR